MTPTPSQPDRTDQLHRLMQRVGLSSFKALSRRAEVSIWQITQLRRGKISQLRVAHLLKLSQTLQLPLAELFAVFESDSSESVRWVASQPPAPSATANQSSLEQEYQRLQNQLDQQQQTLIQEFQRSSLQVLESWLLQWPTAAYAAQQNPQLSATKLLPLLKPVERLLEQWNVIAIAAVGEQLPYDPLWHQLMEGTAQPGELVKVRYTGYRQGNTVLYRAKVSPIS